MHRDKPIAAGPEELKFAPEGWFQYHFPEVFLDPSEIVFVEEDGEITGFTSEFIVARCLGYKGSPSAPLVFCPDTDEFLQYYPSSGLYHRLSKAEARARVAHLLEACAKGCERQFRAQVYALRTRRVIAAVLEALKSESQIPASAFSRDYRHVHVENGILDLRSLRLKPFTPLLPARNKIPVSWRADAPAPKEFLGWIRGMFPSDANRRLALDVLAMPMLGNPFQRIALFLGHERSGKSTLVKLMIAFVGEEAAGQLRMKHAGGRFEAARWAGKSLLYQLEATADTLAQNSDQLKAISGQDNMEAELKSSREVVRFVPRALPAIAANANLRVKLEGDRGAWQERLLALPVSKPTILRRVPNFERRLLQREGQGILRIVAEAAQKLLHNGMPSLSTAQLLAVKRLLDDSDPVEQFVSIHVAKQNGACIYAAEACRLLEDFLKRNHYQPIGDRERQSRLKAAIEAAFSVKQSHSLPKKGGLSQRGWRGVCLR